MKLKKYMVENMSQAMDKIRDDFGDDAYIFDTKKIKKGGFLGLGGRKMIEVTVVSENENGENYTENNKDKFVPNNSSDIYNLQQMVNQNKRLNERINKLKNTETPQENDNSKQDIFKL
ncbi:MAG TPA: hypothetical protein PLS66_11330, partial [Tepiditoga sp.]|nr:hypothetical protein [Tepiditoga sp.]